MFVKTMFEFAQRFSRDSKLPFNMNSRVGAKRPLEKDEEQETLEGPILKKHLYDNFSVEDFVQKLAKVCGRN